MTAKRKLLLLGGVSGLLPVIEAAHRLDCHVITCDYLPENIAHRFSDEFWNISITDAPAVLDAARKHRVDGVMTFAVDAGAVTTAYVQEKLHLPGNPLESVRILQNKGRFRNFLRDHGFSVPETATASTLDQAQSILGDLPLPLMVKPVDSAGSKGVSVIREPSELPEAFRTAMAHSLAGTVILEEFLPPCGNPSDSDCFSTNGELTFVSYSAQSFDPAAENPFAPAAYHWPGTFAPAEERALTGELQRLLHLLEMKTSLYNVETRICRGMPYLMEVSPRGGGNRIAEMLLRITGVDLIAGAVRGALGDDPEIHPAPLSGNWAEVILHAAEPGIFRAIHPAEEIRNFVREIRLDVEPGDRICAFGSGRDALGTAVLQFPDRDTMLRAMQTAHSLFQVERSPLTGKESEG